MGLIWGKRFEKALARLAAEDRRRALKAIEPFSANPRHPSLNFERLTGHPDKYTIRVTRGLRMLLQAVDDDYVLVVTVDNHDLYDKL